MLCSEETEKLVARTRTTKKLAQRIDLNYFKRPTPFKRAKLWLTILIPALAIAWIAWRGVTRDSRVYSSGRMSAPHAVLEKQCSACHVSKAGEFSSAATDSACLSCHDGPQHHENQIASAVPNCATCHMEHRGRIQLVAASDQSCAECHAHLRVTNGQLHYAANIESLENGHPEFAALRSGAKDRDTILLNHAIHMKPVRQGPNGPIVQLECTDCHRPAGVNLAWPYEDQQYSHATPSYFSAASASSAQGTLQSPMPPTGRETMLPPKFATACARCHLLSFDKHFDVGVPHDTPGVIHRFLSKKFQEYIAAHPAEVRVVRDPQRDLTGKPLPPEVRVLTAAQWVGERTAAAEELLYRKTCKQCHTFVTPSPSSPVRRIASSIDANDGNSSLPEIAAAQMKEKWFPHAKFDHDAHRGFSCTGCHEKALTSTETADILVPGIATCKTCHAPGPDHAESRCFECHTYHDWSKRKEVHSTFTLPALQSSGR